MADRDYMAELRTATMSGVEQNAKAFKKPDDDLMPVFIYIDGAGKTVVVLMNNSAPDEEGVHRAKQQMAGLMEALIRRERAQAAALMMSVWIATAPRDTPRELVERMQASKRPDRKEVLWLQITDGQEYEVWQADLIRHTPNPPTVGEWTKVEGVMKNSEGRFVIWRIFRRALGMRDEAHQT